MTEMEQEKENGILPETFLDHDLMQELQDRFCAANSVYVTCYTRSRGMITKPYGDEEALRYISERVGERYYRSILEKLRLSRIENVIEEKMEEPFLRCCGVAVRVKGQLAAAWIVIAVIPGEDGALVPEFLMTTTENQFLRSLEFLETLSKQFLSVKMDELFAQEAEKRSNEQREEVEKQLRRNEAITAIVQLLESDNSFARTVNDILEQTVRYLNLGSASLLRLSRDGESVDMICEWVGKNGTSYLDKVQQLPADRLPFLTGKPYMISADSMKPERFQKLFDEQGIRAAVSLPVEVNGKVGMYLCIVENETDRIWDVGDLKFLNDVRQIIQSILSKRITRNSLASSYASLEAILENVGCGIFLEEPEDHRILYVNRTFRKLFPNSGDEIRGDALFTKSLGENEEGYIEVYSDKEERWYDYRCDRIHWVDGREVELYTVYDITERKNYQHKVEKQANEDYLTGLYNRMRCEQDLDRYIREAKELSGEGALIYIDLDDFKHLNDGLGHEYGDLLLKLIASSLQKIPGVESTCYRMGGDEFSIILTMHNYYMLQDILEEIREIFSQPWYLNGEDYYCTMSCGIVRFPTDGNSASEIIKKADIALYEAKKNGKNHVIYYDDHVAMTRIRRVDMERQLRDAVADGCGEFEVYYQPVERITGDRYECAGAEALVRWNSRSLGFISPVDFVPLAEYMGLIVPIGDHVLQEAVRHCKYWNDCGHPEYRVHVNLSVVQLLQSDIADKVRDILRRTRLNPENLILEVTEALAINDLNRMKGILNEIKKTGARLALDDFGTGLSSLNHIRALPIDMIKVDRCFVMDIERDLFSEVFIRMVIELAETIGVETCVEGVEDEKQLEMLRGMNTQLIQGYYFGIPIAAAEFDAKHLEVG